MSFILLLLERLDLLEDEGSGNLEFELDISRLASIARDNSDSDKSRIRLPRRLSCSLFRLYVKLVGNYVPNIKQKKNK